MVLRIFCIPGITSLIKLIQIAPGQLKPDGTAMLVIAVTQSSHGPGLVRRAVTSCRSTSSSTFLDADERLSRTSQLQSRTKIR